MPKLTKSGRNLALKNQDDMAKTKDSLKKQLQAKAQRLRRHTKRANVFRQDNTYRNNAKSSTESWERKPSISRTLPHSKRSRRSEQNMDRRPSQEKPACTNLSTTWIDYKKAHTSGSSRTRTRTLQDLPHYELIHVGKDEALEDNLPPKPQ